MPLFAPPKTVTHEEVREKYRRLRDNIPGMVYLYARHSDGSVSFPYADSASRVEPLDERHADPQPGKAPRADHERDAIDVPHAEAVLSEQPVDRPTQFDQVRRLIPEAIAAEQCAVAGDGNPAEGNQITRHSVILHDGKGQKH